MEAVTGFIGLFILAAFTALFFAHVHAVAKIAEKNGRGYGRWFFYALFVPAIAIIHLNVILPDTRRNPDPLVARWER